LTWTRTVWGKQAEEHGKGRLIGELVQNALDEEGVTKIDITLEPVRGRPLVQLTVADDSPEGFRDLADAYTLFAPSYKRGNPEQRGQFNFGEKLVLSVCESASIATTKGAVLFVPGKGRIAKPRYKRERGSVFCGRMKMTRDEYAEVCGYLRSLLLPDEVVVNLNGDRLQSRKPLHTFEASLETLVADEEGVMRSRVRKTNVSIYEAARSGEASLYEMGLPIVETGDKWHINVGQKVPLNRDRNNVKPSFLKKVRTLVLNEMKDRLKEKDANDDWVRQASSDPACSKDAIRRVLDLRFGEKRAAYDMSDPEANKTWMSKGGTVVYGGMMSAAEWKNAKEAGAIQPAGQLCPTPKPYSDDPDAKPVTIIPEDQWTAGMRNIVDYAMFLAKELMDVGLREVDVRRVVQVPILLRGDERQVRLEEANRQEEGLVSLCQPPQVVHRLPGQFAISVGVVRHVRCLIGRPTARFVPGLCRQALRESVGGRRRPPRRLGPPLGVVLGMMEHLPIGNGVVAVLAEVGVERRDAGSVPLGPGQVVHEPMARRADAGHQAGPGSPAGRHHAVGSLEDHALGGQPVDIWAVHLPVAEAAKLGPQVVHGDEEDVGAPVGGPGRTGKQRDQQEAKYSTHG